jgi:hypothetical protein
MLPNNGNVFTKPLSRNDPGTSVKVATIYYCHIKSSSSSKEERRSMGLLHRENKTFPFIIKTNYHFHRCMQLADIEDCGNIDLLHNVCSETLIINQKNFESALRLDIYK